MLSALNNIQDRSEIDDDEVPVDMLSDNDER